VMNWIKECQQISETRKMNQIESLQTMKTAEKEMENIKSKMKDFDTLQKKNGPAAVKLRVLKSKQTTLKQLEVEGALDEDSKAELMETEQLIKIQEQGVVESSKKARELLRELESSASFFPEIIKLLTANIQLTTGNNRKLSEYEVLEKWGPGKVVVKAKFEGKLCAIKKYTVSDSESRKKFERESQILRKLKHPLIIHIDSIFNEGNDYFVQMPFYPMNLGEWFEKKKPNFFELKNILNKILHAISYVHREGIIHCDIKPSNILMTEDGEPVLADFDVSRDLTKLAATRTMIYGTADYMVKN
jgi:serine/threonine protein kinase